MFNAINVCLLYYIRNFNLDLYVQNYSRLDDGKHVYIKANVSSATPTANIE